ncbi:MAG: hypothetical protein ACXWQR_04960 [Ktedonobacterales bacterium]
MAGFRWKAIDQYVPWMQTLVRFMWQHTPAPMQPAEFASAAGIPRQMLSRWLAAGPDVELAPEPTALRGAARAMGVPTSQLMTLVGYGSAEDPFLDREEAWTWVRDALDRASDAVVDPAERTLAARVLDAVRDALRDSAPVDQATEAHEVNADRDDTDSAAAVAIGMSDGDAEHLDGQGEP